MRKQRGSTPIGAGFTIIELIVVIAIIAVLAAIVMSNVAGYIAKAKNAKRLSEAGNYIEALNLYYADHGSYPIAEGGDGYGYCCLGTNAITSTCLEDAYKCTTADSALSPYIPGLPTDNSGTVGGMNGYGYNTDFGDGTCTTNGCSDFEVDWIMQGMSGNPGDPCGMGKIAQTEPDGIICGYSPGGSLDW